jgi:hypothetical protein
MARSIVLPLRWPRRFFSTATQTSPGQPRPIISLGANACSGRSSSRTGRASCGGSPCRVTRADQIAGPSRSSRVHLGLDATTGGILGAVQIISALQVEPVLGRLAGKARQPQILFLTFGPSSEGDFVEGLDVLGANLPGRGDVNPGGDGVPGQDVDGLGLGADLPETLGDV